MRKALAILAALAATVLHGCGEPSDARPFKIVPGGKCTTEHPCPTPAKPEPSFTVDDASIDETAGTVTIHVRKAGGNDKASSVSYATADGSAVAGSDYTAVSGTLNFSSTDANKTFTVAIANDSTVEDPETFTVNLTSVTNAKVIRNGTVTIVSEDVAPPPPPPPPNTWTKCADENQTCYVVGTANVRYGASGHYATRSVTGSVLCANSVFGDPIFGTVKTCETDGTVGSAPPPPPPPVQCPNGTTVPAGQTCPTPPPSNTGWTPTKDLNGIDGIATPDFNPALGRNHAGLPPSNCPNGPGTSNCDDQGAFRFICAPGQVLADDPIVYPDQPGKSHLHQFYGNLDTNAHSDYASSRAHGKSTCAGPDYALNRSGYWMSALLDGKGNVVRPSYAVVYYKRFPKTTDLCAPPYATACVGIPNGLKMIAGRDMLNLSAPGPYPFSFTCTKSTGQMAADASGKTTFTNMRDVLAICPAGQGWQLTFVLGFPNCWDGKNIDSPDHRSHVAYATFRGSPGRMYCPRDASGHLMYFMPTFTLTAAYAILAGDTPTLWSLSSDMMAPNEPAGSTLHADYLEAWDPPTKQEWTDNCIDKLFSCFSGNLGDGFALPGAAQPPNGPGPPTPRLIPVAQITVTP